jgi:hypothetical protein
LEASCALSSSEKESEHMSVSVEKQAIRMSLDPLFQEAEEKGLWFFHKSDEAGEIWCSDRKSVV